MLYSLDPIERTRYREIMNYLFQGKACVHTFKRKNSDAELALFPTRERNSETKSLCVHLALSERDKLAHHLFSHKEDYAQALAHFKIPLDKLEREARWHEHRQAILAFIKAEQNGHVLLSQNLAYGIKHSMTNPAIKKSYGSIIRELEFKGMTWEKIHLSAWAYGERHKGSISPEQKAAIKAYATYRSLNRDLAAAVGRNQPHEKEQAHSLSPQREKQIKQIKYMRIKALVDQRDRSAHQLWNELINLDEHSLKKLDITRLQKESDTHIRREEVKSLKARMDNGQLHALQNELKAKALLQNPAYEKLIKEQRLQYKVKNAIKALEQRQALAAIPLKERKLYHEVQEYRTLSYQTAKAWKRSFAKAKSPQALIQQVHNTQIAQAFNEKRNELAFKISQNYQAYESHLAALGVDTAKLQKAAHHYQRKQTYNNQVQHYRTLLLNDNVELKKESYNADRISEALIDMGESFYQKVLGDLYIKPKRYSSNIRVGEKAFFSFQVSGSHRGAWHSFESGEGGYPLQLLMNANYGYGLSFEDALKEGARIAGLSDSQAKDITYVRKQKPLAEIEAEARLLAQEKQRRIETARYYYKTSKPIEGTIAERYLRETRHIEGDLSGFRFHPRVKDPETERYYPAVLIAAKNEQGRIMATQTILIDSQTLKKAEVEVPKRTRGAISGSAAMIHQGSSNKVLIAEGPETAASLIKAMPEANIYVTVGNIRNSEHLGWLAKKHNTDTFYFAADNDGENMRPVESLQKAAAKLEVQGIKCYKAVPKLKEVATPDFNDVLIYQGMEGVKAQLDTMHRIINESEKITLGLIKAETKQVKIEPKAEQPEFWVDDNKIRLSKPLLEQIGQFVNLTEQISTQLSEANRLNMSKENPEKLKQVKAAMNQSKEEQRILSGELMKYKELWKTASTMRQKSITTGGLKMDVIKADIKYNCFDAENLQHLHLKVKGIIRSHEESLQQQLGRGRSF